ncbi:MAG: hypothetical protein A3K08_01135 [Candidatus Doudnabacteria bacterium RIFCSPLOWO2_01_41_7]|nr:MAG: hypothetical protein A3K08_01135 [Candidatus Doudnabacteria bacterium RIFCSPLOWO2_01_41_7]
MLTAQNRGGVTVKKLVLLVLLTTAVGTAHAQLIQPRTITNIEDLSRIGAEMPTNTETYDVYKVGGRYQIYYFQVSSFSTMLDYLGRVLLWSDLQTTQLKGLGDGVINQLDDYNHDGKLVEKDVLYAVLVIWGARGQAAGVTYDLAHTMKAFNAYLAAGRTLQVSMSRAERSFLSDLERFGLIKEISGQYEVLKPASIVMVQPLNFFRDLDPKSVILHELNHAVVFQEPRFRQAVAEIWKTMLPAEQAAIKERLGRIGLNVENFELLTEEFAAYAEEGFTDSVLNSFGELNLIVPSATLTRLQGAVVQALKTFNAFGQ